MTRIEYCEKYCSKCINKNNDIDLCDIRINTKNEPQCVYFHTLTSADLKEYRNREINIKSELQTLEEKRARIEGTTQNFDGMPKAKNKVSYSMEQYLDDKAKVEKQILMQEDLYMNLIRERLNKLKPIHATILREYYINAKSLEEVSVIIERGYYRTCHLNGEALIEFNKLNEKI